ncbi:hypothetical protein [Oscillatoria sp. FACHB-1407]|nr:hypothetical protein [Oscillatoria sp. FACHB-1407]
MTQTLILGSFLTRLRPIGWGYGYTNHLTLSSCLVESLSLLK